jgi:uncharacterized NAD-dependent epimerase/dehydratase family protein
MHKEKALILCENSFGKYLGKTANGLVRHSERFEIIGVIDSAHAGKMAHEVVEGAKEDIRVYSDLKTALEDASKPDFLIIGVATIGGMIPEEFRPVLIEAIKNNINIIAGLHEFLNDDPELSKLAKEHGVELIDIRKEPPLENMHQFSDLCKNLDTVRIPVLGTDSSIGKRTTAIELVKALNARGIKSVFVATGQTGLLQGAKFGVPLDSIQGDYMVGELEHAIIKAYEEEKPKVIVIEGQGSISHPAYVSGSRAIITASQPNGIVLQHAPGRKYRNYRKKLLNLPMPDLREEIDLIEIFSKAKVLGITINNESMSDDEVEDIMARYEDEFDLPACDILRHGCDKLVEQIKRIFPELN